MEKKSRTRSRRRGGKESIDANENFQTTESIMVCSNFRDALLKHFLLLFLKDFFRSSITTNSHFLHIE